MKTIIHAALAALLLAPCALAAQANPSALVPDQRIRIQATEAGFWKPIPATVVALRADSLVVNLGTRDPDTGALTGVETTIALAAIDRLEVSRGRGMSPVQSAFGGAVGSALGLAAARIHRSSLERWQVRVDCERGPDCLLGYRREWRSEPDRSALIVGGTAVAGLVVGALIPRERWRRTPVVASWDAAEDRGVLALRITF